MARTTFSLELILSHYLKPNPVNSMFNDCGLCLAGTGNSPNSVRAPACVNAWELSGQYSGANGRLTQFVPPLLVITALSYLSRILKIVISHILSVFLVVSGDRGNLVPVSSSWLQIQIVLLFYCLFYRFLFWHVYFHWVLF